MLLPLVASAEKVEIDGIWYNLNSESKTAEVAQRPFGEYKGSIVIPMLVSYENIQYSVTSIEEFAFSYCSNLASVTIGNSVTSIGDYAFHKCSGLTSVTIGNGVTSIGEWAFDTCPALTSISVVNGNTVYDSRNDCNAIIETESNTLILGCKNTIIPNSVTNIGNRAFSECSGLTSVTIPNSVTSIGKQAFYYCSGLTSVIIGNSVKSIGDYAFTTCSGLTSITIPNSVKSIGNGAFSECTGLTSVAIPNSVTSIGDFTFYYCLGLTSVTIGNSVTSIGTSAFSRCDVLTSITIPNSVTNIGEFAFHSCDGLTSVTSLSPTPPTITLTTFDSYYTAVLKVPTGSKAAYQADENWKYFENVEEIDVAGVQGIQVDKRQNTMVYDLNGWRLDAPTKGVSIINGRKVLVK